MDRSLRFPAGTLLTLFLLAPGPVGPVSAQTTLSSPPFAPTPVGAPVNLPAARSGPNMLINGDFEVTTLAPGCYYNQDNTQVSAALLGITAYGGANEIDVMTDGTPCLFVGPPQSGMVKLAIHLQSTGLTDEFSFALSSPVVAGGLYEVSCYAWAALNFDPNIGAVEMGLSSSPTSFGTLVFSDFPATTAWTPLSHTFTAPVNASYLTVRVGGPLMSWLHIDNFALVNAGPTRTAATTWGRLKSIYR